jgi:YegS/Rv2252/BmrU family lipid kinase
MVTTLFPQPKTRLKRVKAFQNACLIFNPVSGQGDPDQELAAIRSFLEPHLPLQVCLTTPTVGPGQLAKAAIAQGADLIIASGGDGTVSAAASAVVNTGIPLAIIPRGTANAFANGLDLPLTLEAACIAILQGATRTIGTVNCNGQLMLLLAGIGFEANTVQAADRQLKDQFGMLAYVLAGLEELQHTTWFQACLETERQTITVPAIAITVASIAPPTSILAQGTGDMRPDDGLFDVTILSPSTGLDVLTAAIELLGNGLIRSTSEDNHIGYLRTNKVTITTDPPQQIAMDGEMIGTTPATFTVLPQSLVVVTDYHQAIAARQNLTGLPEVEIVNKHGAADEVVLDYFLPVHPLDVVSREFGQVAQASLTLWHVLISALKHSGLALLEWAMQVGYELVQAIATGMEAMIDSVRQLLSHPIAETATSVAQSTSDRASAIQIAHQTIGRIRLKISRLSRDQDYAEQVRSRVQGLEGIREITINPLAASIAVQFDPQLPGADMKRLILASVGQVA